MSQRVKKIKIGVMPLAQYKARTIAIAKGEYCPQSSEPKLWFNSMKSLANVFCEENQALLQIIIDKKPQSVSELEPITGRKANNLLRTLRLLENYGLVELLKGRQGRGRAPLIPKVLYDVVDIELHFNALV